MKNKKRFNDLKYFYVAITLIFMFLPYSCCRHTKCNVEQDYIYIHSAKFTCAPEVGGDQIGQKEMPFEPGFYRTVVNVHNFSYNPVSFTIKAVIACSHDATRGKITPKISETLKPDQALAIDCNDIYNLFGGFQPVGDGFVVIESKSKLDVTAVYTVLPKDSMRGISIDVEQIHEQKLSIKPQTKGLPDLEVKELDMNSLKVDCPGGAGTCISKVTFTIVNIGLQDAGSFNIRIMFDPNQSVIVDVPVPNGISSGAAQSFTISTPPNGNCYDPNCTICVIVDSNDDVIESNEINNEQCETKQG